MSLTRSLAVCLITSLAAHALHAGVSFVHAFPLAAPPNGKPLKADFQFDVSKNGRFVAFASSSNELVPGVDPLGKSQIFRLDRKLGKIVLMTRATNGAPANGECLNPSLSDDGRRVAFLTHASNLNGPANGKVQIGYADLETGETRIVSQSWDGKLANTPCYWPDISGNGKFVAFSTDASSLFGPSGGVYQVFQYDVENDKLGAKSFGNSGQWGDGHSYAPHQSFDGRYISYETQATNLPDPGKFATTRVVCFDRKTGDSFLMSAAENGLPANQSCFANVISEDARYVGFLTYATNLTPEPLALGTPSVIVVDRLKKKVKRYDVGVAGYPSSLKMSANGQRLVVGTEELLPGGFFSGLRAVVIDRTTAKSWPLDLMDPEFPSAADSIHPPVLSANGKKLFFGSYTAKLGAIDPALGHLYVAPVTNP